MAKKVQNVNLLIECEKRFSQKPWYSEAWLNALMGRLAYLNDDEVGLILELTEGFNYHRLNDINAMLFSAFCKIPAVRLNQASKILFAPLKSPYYHIEEKKIKRRRKKEGWDIQALASKVKSSDHIFWLMQIDYPAKYKQYAHKIVLCPNPQDIDKHYDKEAIIVLWDDFVGTGDTAFTAIAGIQHYLSSKKMEAKEGNFVIVSMCAMKNGIEVLQYFNLECYAAEVYGKAISDDSRFSDIERAQRRTSMLNVEKKVVKNAPRSYSLGYEQSEALLSIMDKCPNNTFPFYWYKSQHGVVPVFYRQK